MTYPTNGAVRRSSRKSEAFNRFQGPLPQEDSGRGGGTGGTGTKTAPPNPAPRMPPRMRKTYKRGWPTYLDETVNNLWKGLARDAKNYYLPPWARANPWVYAGWYVAGQAIYDAAYRQKNPADYPFPYPANATWSHSWTCPETRSFRFKFWKNHTTWNDSLKCLKAQAQFRTAGSVTVEGSAGTGWEYWDYGDGAFIDGVASGGARHWILWGNYCIGTGCATNRSNVIAHVGWTGAVGEPIRMYAAHPAWQPMVVPAISPLLDPLAVPILQPMAPTRPLPYRVIPHRRPDPNRSPEEQTQRGPEPAPRANSVTAQPTPGITITPGGPITPAPPHTSTPPTSGTRERKVRINGLVNLALGTATEGADIIDALYDALPWEARRREFNNCNHWSHKDYGTSELRRKCMTPQRKLEVVNRYWDQLDVEKAIKNLLKMQVEDAIIGRIAGGITKNLRDRGWHDTFGRGPMSGPAL